MSSFSCRVCCSKNIGELYDFGNVPLAGGFRRDILDSVLKFKLNLKICLDCMCAQVVDIVPPNQLFSDYHYSSSQVSALDKHFQSRASDWLKSLSEISKSTNILDIGCNDGVFIKNFLGKKDVTVVGVDPAFPPYVEENIIRYKAYFDRTFSKFLADEYGEFQFINISNVFAHIPDLNDVFLGMVSLLADDGYMQIEVHSLLELLKSVQYETVYHEHIFYHSLNTMDYFANKYGVFISDIEDIDMHGGAFRVTFTKYPPVKAKIDALRVRLVREHSDITHEVVKFRKKVDGHINFTNKFLSKFNADGLLMGAYGASGRAIMFMSAVDPDARYLSSIYDDAAIRVGKFLPHAAIPVKLSNQLKFDDIDLLVITAWNYVGDITKKLAEINFGGFAVVMFPTPQIVYIPEGMSENTGLGAKIKDFFLNESV